MDSRGYCASQDQAMTLSPGVASFKNAMVKVRGKSRKVSVTRRIEGHLGIGTIGIA